MNPGTDAAAAPPGAAVLEAEYDALYARHWLGLVRLARLLVDDTTSAEDVVQDAFIGLYRQRAALADPAKALPYLRAAVVNRSRSVIRRRVVARRHLRVRRARSRPRGRRAGAARRGAPRRAHRRRALPRRQREVLVLRFWENLTDREIATALGIAEVTVRATVSRGVAAVARLLEQSDAPDRSRTGRPGGGSDV